MRVIAAFLTLVVAAPAAAQNDGFYGGPPEVPQFSPAFEGQTRAPIVSSEVELERETIASGLSGPWGLTQLPDGRLIVTEKPGRMRIVTLDGKLGEPLAGLPDVDARGQGGLLDVSVAPDFTESREVFFTYAQPVGGGANRTAIAKGRLSDDETRLENVTVIFEQTPQWRSTKHFGSRIEWQDNDTLFVGLGERSLPDPRQLAQELDSTIGKVIRIRRDGSVPPDNPFVDGPANALPEIWSYGHRNIQAAAIHPETGALWTIEHGPQGGDEVNVPKPGLNYGWPTITYGENYGGGLLAGGRTQAPGLEQPAYYWSPVIAPSGAAFYDGEMFPEWQGDLLVGGLVALALVRLEIDGERVTGEDRLVRGIGRIRDVEIADDGAILITLDGQGRILRLSRAG